SSEALPPPAMIKVTAIASSASVYSNPPLVKKKPCGQCTPNIATAITEAIIRAPTRVYRPRKTSNPPINSAKAAAVNQAHDGCKLNGAAPEVHAANPLPPQIGATFCMPCTRKIAPSANRTGNKTQVPVVAFNRPTIV